MAAKAVNFSKGSIQWHWGQGYRDALRAIGHAGWLRFVSEDIAVGVRALPSQDGVDRHAD